MPKAKVRTPVLPQEISLIRAQRAMLPQEMSLIRAQRALLQQKPLKNRLRRAYKAQSLRIPRPKSQQQMTANQRKTTTMETMVRRASHP